MYGCQRLGSTAEDAKARITPLCPPAAAMIDDHAVIPSTWPLGTRHYPWDLPCDVDRHGPAFPCLRALLAEMSQKGLFTMLVAAEFHQLRIRLETTVDGMLIFRGG